MIGQRIGSYRILSLLGAGGMGEVYLAEDTNLRRKVALKILPSRFTADHSRLRRFEQEACAASALNHPNIITIHEIAGTTELRYMVMEFIEGETLRQRMNKTRIKLGEVLDIGIQVASAISAAHAAGIVHRDIKPDNVMIRHDALVKVLDFGLAKPAEPQLGNTDSEARTLLTTHPGMVLGTSRYMSPEQASGKAVDARTDIWSLGATLYELIAQRPAFEGETQAAVVARVLERDPIPLSDWAPEMPAELQRIVNKALIKDRDERYQTVKDLLLDLKALKRELEFAAKLERSANPNDFQQQLCEKTNSTKKISETSGDMAQRTAEPGIAQTISSADYLIAGIKSHKVLTLLMTLLFVAAVGIGVAFYFHKPNTETAIKSIAVLPFVNQNGDPNDEYLSDGLTESVINRLAQLQNLSVLPRSTVFRYKGKETDPIAIGNQLGVEAVLSGRIVERGDNLLISVDLVDVRNNKQLWGEQFSRKLADILAIQQEIATEISQRLRLRLSGRDEKQLTKRYTDNTEAYNLYLKGRYHATKYTEEEFRKAIGYFNQAIAIDPNYALAYDGLSYCYYASWYTPPQEASAMGRAAAKKALEIDDTLAEAHTSIGTIHTWFDYDWAAAEREFRRATDLNPNYAPAHQWYSWYLLSVGRPQESIAEAKRAVQLEPLNAEINTVLGLSLFYAHRFDEAAEQLSKTIDLEANYWWAHLYLARVFEKKGQFNQAIMTLQRATLMEGASPEVWSALGYAYAIAGNKAEARKVIMILKEQAKRSYVPPYNIATIYAGLGEKDQAFEYLEKAYDERPFNLSLLKVDPELDSLRSDSRFTDLVRRVGLI